MRLNFTVPILLSFLSASAFSILGAEPKRASRVVAKNGKCKLGKVTSREFKVKKRSNSKILFTRTNKDQSYNAMYNHPQCN